MFIFIVGINDVLIETSPQCDMSNKTEQGLLLLHHTAHQP